MKTASARTYGALLSAALLLSACGNWFGGSTETPLPGQRISVLMRESTVQADERIADLEVRVPRPVANEDWPQAGGDPNHAMHHLAAAGELGRLWSSGIGTGSSDDGQLIAQPVIADGRVYTLDVEAEVRAFDAETGSRVWSRELPTRDMEGILGGGIAFDEGRLYVTTGFADVVALEAATGKEVWRKTLNGPIRAAPTVRGGRVFVVTVANELFALAASDGRQLWTHVGITEVAGLVGGSAPAVDSGVVIVPYTSGEVVALRVENGRMVWSDTLSALRRADAVTQIAHIRGRPVIDRGVVYVVANSNRTVAIDLRTGTRLWEVPVGGRHGPWVAGDFVYVVTRSADLVCLTRRGGRVRWVTQLPRFEDEEEREDAIQWAGPVLAGNRLILASSHEQIWSVSPYDGKVLGRMDAPGPVLISPSVARETVFVLTEEADLIALR